MSPEPIIKWKSWPFVERPLTSVTLVLFLCLLALIVYRIAVLNWQQPIYYIIGMLLVILNLFPYFIQTEYELYDDKYVAKYLIIKVSKPYTDFGCFYMDKKGVMLSTFKMPRRLDAFRGQSFRFSMTQAEKEDVISFLKTKITKQY